MALLLNQSGCLPCGNCFVVVPQDRLVAVESFGSFYKVLEPGLAFAGLDCLGCCISLKGISTRIDQVICQVPSKTSDNVFVTAEVAVQLSIMPDRAQDAVYKLTNIKEQLDSYTSEVVRSELPKLTLDDCFEKKGDISRAIMDKLHGDMAAYGWKIHNALVTDLKVNPDVVRSMNEINKQKRLRDASVMAAEADKIRTVKAAEADADAACLAGQGIARQRGAIIDGLRASLGQGQTISQEDITTLLLTTQYFETLKDIGSRPTSQTYFLPSADPNDADAQIQIGLLQGTVGLSCMKSSRYHRDDHGGDGQTPVQETMSPAPASPASRRPPPAPAFTPPPVPQFTPPPVYTPPPQPPVQQQQPYQQFQPPVQQYRPVVLQVQVPAGAQPGQLLQVQAPDGRIARVQVPPGAMPGQTLQVQI